MTEKNDRPGRKVIDLLDRPGLRWLLGLIVSTHASLKRRERMRIFYDGAWIHRTREGTVVDRTVNKELSPSASFGMAEDLWLHVYKPSPGDTVVDVGAGIGDETHYFSKMVGPEGKVLSIEAHPGTFRCLEKLCEYNELANVIPLNVAVQGEESEVFIDDPDTHVASTILDVGGGIKVQGVTLDSLVEAHGIERIDFLKMNIEGAEKLAIAGMTNSIKMTRYICVSCHDFLETMFGTQGVRTKEPVTRFLVENGFEIVPRNEDARQWIRDQVNGVNRAMVGSR